MGKMNKLPERWVDYIPIGIRMSGTRFVAFKVPLSEIFDSKLTPKQRFSPLDLIRKIKEQNEDLGMIIDLTCTKRYYNPVALPKTLAYSKIYTAGHAIPDAPTIQQFKSIVTQFLSENSDNDKLIGVHCTHGLNRTGYLVCRYLIDIEGMDPDAAIELFNKSRGHSIERQNYILDLQGKPALNDPAQKIPRASMHSGQECVANGNLSSRFSHFQYPHYQAPYQAPWSSSWQHHEPQRVPSQYSRYDRQNERDYPPYQRHHRPWHDDGWRRPQKWEQTAPAPKHTKFSNLDYEEPRFPPPPALPSPVKQQQGATGRRSHDSVRKSRTYKSQKHKET
ncbi:RNA/RNP complex-1-interacting phosphatase isoform X2 [Lissotriton helveticus]